MSAVPRPDAEQLPIVALFFVIDSLIAVYCIAQIKSLYSFSESRVRIIEPVEVPQFGYRRRMECERTHEIRRFALLRSSFGRDALSSMD